MPALPLRHPQEAAAVACRVFVVDDDDRLREGARSVLSSVPGVEVVGLAADPADLAVRILETRPQVVVLDVRMPPTYRMEGIEAARWIRAEHPHLGVVILSQHADPEYALEFLRDGSAGRAYLLKERLGDPAQLVEAILEVAAGGSVLDPKVVVSLMEAPRRRAHSPLQELGAEERDVLGLMASGRTNAAIARDLGLSEPAVDNHVNSTLRTLGIPEDTAAAERVAAIAFYLARTLH